MDFSVDSGKVPGLSARSSCALKPYRHTLFQGYDPHQNELRPSLTPTQACEVLQIFNMPSKCAIMLDNATALVQQNSDDYEEGLRVQRENEIKAQTQARARFRGGCPNESLMRYLLPLRCL